MQHNFSTSLINQSLKILYYYKSKQLLPSKAPLLAYKLVCIVQLGRPGCNTRYTSSPFLSKLSFCLCTYYLIGLIIHGRRNRGAQGARAPKWFCQVKFSLLSMHSYQENWRIKCSFSTKFFASLRSPIKILVNKKSTIWNVQIHLIYLKKICISSKHLEGVQPTIQHPIPFIKFQNNWL